MNLIFSRLLFTLTLSLFVCGAALAKEGGATGVGGGGNAVVLPNDTVVLADPYYPREGNEPTFHCKDGERGQLHPALIEELNRAGHFLVRYGATIGLNRNWSDFITTREWDFREPSKFIAEVVLGPTVEYCFVTKLPHAESQPDLKNLPRGSESHSLAYTEWNVTWFQKDLFRRMSVREQAKAIIHERLHAHAGNVAHGAIVDMTNGLDLLFSIRHHQNRGRRPVLDPAQVAVLQTFMQRIVDLQLYRGRYIAGDDVSGREIKDAKYFVTHHRVTPNGGGLYHVRTLIADDVYLGVGSWVGSGSIVEPGVTLVNTIFCPEYSSYWNLKWDYDPNKKNTAGFRIQAGSLIENSTIHGCSGPVRIGAGTWIKNSRIILSPYSLDEEAFTTGVGVVIEDSTLDSIAHLKVRTGATVSDAILGNSDRYPSPHGNFDLEVGTHSRLAHLALSQVKSEQVKFSWGFMHIAEGPAGLTIDRLTQLDFGGQKLCGHGYLGIFGRHKVSSMKQLFELCRR